MAWSVLQILGGFSILAVGAEVLVRGAAALALRFGVSPLAVGLTVVAFGTSAPELVVCIKAALAEQSGLALGNVVGSNIFNTAAILGFVALLRPITCQASMIRREVPLMLGVTLLLVLFVACFGAPTGAEGIGRLTRWEGAVLVALAVAYTLLTLKLAKGEAPEVQAEFEADLLPLPSQSAERLQSSPLWLNLGLVLLGLILLGVGAELLVTGAVTVAKRFGVSDLVIGLTIVGAGTSLPELATSAVAAYRGESDIALGNIVGSNILNVLGILGVTVAIHPLDVDASLLRRDLPVLVLLTLLCLPITRSGKRISRWEGGVLFAIYLGYLAYLVVEASGS